MQVSNMINNNGNAAANQFVITGCTIKAEGKTYINGTMFQSYNTNIAFKHDGNVYLDTEAWNYSATTAKHRRIFLNGEGVDATRAKIKSGEYTLVDLNG